MMNMRMMMRNTLGLCALAVLASSWVVAARPRDRDDRRLTGTYELERTRGDDPQRAAESATRNLPDAEHDRVFRRLVSRLEPPETLAIDRRGDAVTMESSLGARTTFDADGRTHNERAANGRDITTRADMRDDRLTVSTTGDRGSDYLVTFEPVSSGDELRVTRRFDSEELRSPVTVTSFYRRVSSEPRWDVYRSGSSARREDRESDHPVPDGTLLRATLDKAIGTRSSHSGDRFSLTVRSPREFEGARLDGVVSKVNRSTFGHKSADLVVDFESIRLPSGHVDDFDGVLDSLQTRGGDDIHVDSEGGVSGEDNDRVQRGAIGAALGAVIGAIAGGGKGAAIGAVVGGAGGAFVVNGRDDFELDRGSDVAVRAIAPPRAHLPRN
jgi:hypothetical protein